MAEQRTSRIFSIQRSIILASSLLNFPLKYGVTKTIARRHCPFGASWPASLRASSSRFLSEGRHQSLWTWLQNIPTWLPQRTLWIQSQNISRIDRDKARGVRLSDSRKVSLRRIPQTLFHSSARSRPRKHSPRHAHDTTKAHRVRLTIPQTKCWHGSNDAERRLVLSAHPRFCLKRF